MKKVILYTDGGCRNNGKKNNIGAIGGILFYPKKDQTKEFSQAFDKTTNNRMELLAIITGLNYLKEACEVDLYSDSAYVVNAINQGWLKNWKKNNWKRGKEELKNKDLWQQLDQLLNFHQVNFKKVKGHSDNELNNRADYLVNEAMDELERSRK